jgi:hypothetical protein
MKASYRSGMQLKRPAIERMSTGTQRGHFPIALIKVAMNPASQRMQTIVIWRPLG